MAVGVPEHQYFGRILFDYKVINSAISYYRSYIYIYTYAIGYSVWRITTSDRSRLTAHARWQVATAWRTPRPHGYVLKAKD